MIKNRKRDTERAARIKRTAIITGYSQRYIQAVLSGDRENEQVESIYFSLLDADRETDNKLLREVKRIVPFN